MACDRCRWGKRSRSAPRSPPIRPRRRQTLGPGRQQNTPKAYRDRVRVEYPFRQLLRLFKVAAKSSPPTKKKSNLVLGACRRHDRAEGPAFDTSVDKCVAGESALAMRTFNRNSRPKKLSRASGFGADSAWNTGCGMKVSFGSRADYLHTIDDDQRRRIDTSPRGRILSGCCAV